MQIICSHCRNDLTYEPASSHGTIDCPRCGRRWRLPRAGRRARPGPEKSRVLMQIVIGVGAAVLLVVGMVVCYHVVVGDLKPPGPDVESPMIPIRPEDATGPRVLTPGSGPPGATSKKPGGIQSPPPPRR
jgi:hypothetical protein